MPISSRLEGFYKLTPGARLEWIANVAELSPAEIESLLGGGLSIEEADKLVENAVGLYSLPLGVAANFTINRKDYLIPMVVEEPSVVAACSHAAKIVRVSGGFLASADDPLMVGQIQVLFDTTTDPSEAAELDETIGRLREARNRVVDHRQELLAKADSVHPNLVARGGGARDLEVREFFNTRMGPMIIVYLTYDTRDAMGANIINTACEAIAPQVAELTGGRTNLRILSNLTDRRLARASCRISPDALGGEEIARTIVEAQVMAEVDRYRAATHNKGVMNGIDAVALATGNDWRAIEAGAHAYAARDGGYRPLTTWELASNGDLIGSLEMPMAVGIVGGLTRVHEVVKIALKLMQIQSGPELAAVMAAVGLAQNLSALRALATEGIQRGHMRLHRRRAELAEPKEKDE